MRRQLNKLSKQSTLNQIYFSRRQKQQIMYKINERQPNHAKFRIVQLFSVAVIIAAFVFSIQFFLSNGEHIGIQQGGPSNPHHETSVFTSNHNREESQDQKKSRQQQNQDNQNKEQAKSDHSEHNDHNHQQSVDPVDEKDGNNQSNHRKDMPKQDNHQAQHNHNQTQNNQDKQLPKVTEPDFHKLQETFYNQALPKTNSQGKVLTYDTKEALVQDLTQWASPEAISKLIGYLYEQKENGLYITISEHAPMIQFDKEKTKSKISRTKYKISQVRKTQMSGRFKIIYYFKYKDNHWIISDYKYEKL